MAFGEIIGQETVIQHLQNALRTGSVSHAYILSGGRGSGRKMLAQSFAAALLCQDPAVGEDGTYEACGKCLSCLQAQSGNHPDILTLEREKAGSIGVGEIRRLRADMQIVPYSSEHKIYIVPDAERMTQQAQNALLKTLEEPPSYGVLLLLADGVTAFLPTVLSRCITLQLRPVSAQAIEQLLTSRYDTPPEKARMCARFAGGLPGKAIRLSESEEFAAVRDRTVGLLRRIEQADAHEIAEAARESAAGGETDNVLDFTDSWFRDILVYKSTGDEGRLIFPEEIQYIKDAADMLSYGSLQRVARARETAGRRLKANVNTELVLEMLFLQIRQACAADRRRTRNRTNG